MTAWLEHLGAVASAAAGRADAKPAPALASALNQVGYVSGEWRRHDEELPFWEAFHAEYGFLSAVWAGRPLTAADEGKWADLLGWMIVQLRLWSPENDPGLLQLGTLLALAGTMEKDGALWSVLAGTYVENNQLPMGLIARIEDAQIELQLQNGGSVPSSALVEASERAGKAQEWAQLGELFSLVLDYHDASGLTQAVRALQHLDASALITAASKVAAPFKALAIAAALTADGSLRLAVGRANPLQKFACAFRSLFRQTPLSAEAQGDLTALLIQVSADIPTWRGWMAVFNKFPVRYPSLQRPLGEALASVGAEAAAGYIDSFQLNTMPQKERELVTECLKTFSAKASAAHRRQLWAAAKARWQSWDFGRDHAESHLADISTSVIDYAVVGYFVECVPTDDRARGIEGIHGEIKAIDSQWHATELHCLTTRNRLISRLQPLMHAHGFVGPGYDWLPLNRSHTPDGGAARRYFEIKYTIMAKVPVVDGRRPDELSSSELSGFEKLVLAAGEVQPQGLAARIRDAEWLLELRKGRDLIGVGALKRPEENYRAGVASKSGIALEPNDYPFELGWLHVLKVHEGHRYSRLIINAALRKAEGRGIFATTRSDNQAIHHILPQHGFVLSGKRYPSPRGAYDLVLFVRAAAPPIDVPWP